MESRLWLTNDVRSDRCTRFAEKPAVGSIAPCGAARSRRPDWSRTPPGTPSRRRRPGRTGAGFRSRRPESGFARAAGAAPRPRSSAAPCRASVPPCPWRRDAVRERRSARIRPCSSVGVQRAPGCNESAGAPLGRLPERREESACSSPADAKHRRWPRAGRRTPPLHRSVSACAGCRTAVARSSRHVAPRQCAPSSPASAPTSQPPARIRPKSSRRRAVRSGNSAMRFVRWPRSVERS